MTRRLSFYDYTRRVLDMTAIGEVWALHRQMMAQYGFNRLLYTSSRLLPDEETGITDDSLILTNHSQEMIDVFIGEGLYEQTPTRGWIDQERRAISWEVINTRFAESGLTASEQRMRELSEDMKIMAGYTIVFGGETQMRATIGLCAREGLTQDAVEKKWEALGEEILTLNTLMHLKLSALPFTGLRRPLTSRQREVLRRVAAGATTQEIARALELTGSAVEKHLRLARASLGVRTTVQAVQRAMGWKLL